MTMEQNSEFRYTLDGRGLKCASCGTGAQTKGVPCPNCEGEIFETPTDEEVLKTGTFLTGSELDSQRSAKTPKRPKRAA